MTLKEKKLAGLQQQAEKTVDFINDLRNSLAIESDTSVRFTLIQKLKEKEQQLEEIEDKIKRLQMGEEVAVDIGEIEEKQEKKRSRLVPWVIGGIFALIIAIWGFNTWYASPQHQTFEDPRDGQIYPTVKIGDKVWLAKNLNYETPNSWCYDDDPLKCDKFGRLYSYGDAMKACPRGWHLPSAQEWQDLAKTFDPNLEQKDATFVVIPNNYQSKGFVPFLSGMRTKRDTFDDLNFRANFWSSTKITGKIGEAVIAKMVAPDKTIFDDLTFETGTDVNSGLSCRCVQN